VVIVEHASKSMTDLDHSAITPSKRDVACPYTGLHAFRLRKADHVEAERASREECTEAARARLLASWRTLLGQLVD
jgi:hypothetical protein